MFRADQVYKKDLFAGQAILITGGGSGIGRRLAHGFASLGGSLALLGRRREKLEETAAELKTEGYAVDVLCLACDISDPKQVKQAVAEAFRWKEIDILINNAGANSLRPAEALTPVRWQAIIDTVLNGTFYMSRECAVHWIKRRRAGHIINIASTTAWTGSPFMAPSGAAKAGIVNLGRTLGSEWAKYKIRINDVSPGPVFTKGSFDRLWLNEKIVEEVQRRVPLGRFPEPDDIVGPVIFLASPAAAMMTGATIAVDGGESLRPDLGSLVDSFRPRRETAGDEVPEV